MVDPRNLLSLVGTDSVGWGQKLRLAVVAGAATALPVEALLADRTA